MFDRDAIAHAYAVGAEWYASKFGNELSSNEFDRFVVKELVDGLAVGSSVLDVGCGPAQVSAFVQAHGHRPVAVDLTLEMLLIARRRLANEILVCADLRFLPLAAASFDAAVSWFSLHNLPRAM